ncbi:RcnB family protein [Acinetobacter kyonggiensis]|uniref:Regulator RcnB of Ni and Co efflux n=1 Tax=Acinetobacter kyonggiensis TaxID=595670 RepID=A0A1H3KVS6_9GAMM|nr:RcnB family protein [Acinetobacter kyonggiensis]SDY56262.1 regulator RcnB of Ni and Co efflux [Acinetobacter kyonggiensis]
MKKILTILAISFSALMANSVTTAAPHDNDRNWDQPRHQSENKGRDFRDNDDDERMQDKRRVREERGVKRLQQHKWQTGYVMPQHYRGNGYKVDYKEHDLPKPSRNQQWYKINNDYILVDTDSNNILRIQGF